MATVSPAVFERDAKVSISEKDKQSPKSFDEPSKGLSDDEGRSNSANNCREGSRRTSKLARILGIFYVRILMEATGLEKGGIYRHFDSKEQLAAKAFEYAWQAELGIRMRDLESISNSVERLKRYITNFVQRRAAVPGGSQLRNTAIMPTTAIRNCARSL